MGGECRSDALAVATSYNREIIKNIHRTMRRDEISDFRGMRTVRVRMERMKEQEKESADRDNLKAHTLYR